MLQLACIINMVSFVCCRLIPFFASTLTEPLREVLLDLPLYHVVERLGFVMYIIPVYVMTWHGRVDSCYAVCLVSCFGQRGALFKTVMLL
jgi:hypothetical protein